MRRIACGTQSKQKLLNQKKVLGTKIHQKATTKDIPWEL
jgi:hypothetical protein